MEHNISTFIPKIGEDLALYKGKEVLERFSIHVLFRL